MKIRKYIHVVLAIFLLVSNIGLAFNVHYCGDSVASISVTSFVKETIGGVDCCGKKIIKSSCCKDKKVVLEKKSEQSILKDFSFVLEFPMVCCSWTPTKFYSLVSCINIPKYTYVCEANAPPLYQLYSQYIYYA